MNRVQGPQEEVVRVDRLVKDFRVGLGTHKRRVLDGISFSVREGEIFGFVGPNGAGKTTTLKILMGLIFASSGSATIVGHDVRESEFRRHVGFLPENPYFYDYLTGREILEFYARLSGLSKARMRNRAETLLDWVGLAHAANSRLRTYSKGMLQRIGIAQALVHDPSVVFLDEPMSGLDPIGRKEIRDLILRLHEEGKTVFMNTHILTDVEMLCDRVAIIVQGQIRYEGITNQLLQATTPETDIVFTGLSPELASRFEEHGAKLRGIADRIQVRVAEKDATRVLREALNAGAEVTSVAVHRASLESIFLSAVGIAQPKEDGL
jgi:ABC-2 type transport system ATP-binding protein